MLKSTLTSVFKHIFFQVCKERSFFLLSRIIKPFFWRSWQNNNNIHFFNSANKTQYIQEDFLLGRIIFIFPILQKRHSIRSFFAWQKNKDFFPSNLPSCLGHFLYFIIVSKINQGSCLGCLGGDDAPEGSISSFHFFLLFLRYVTFLICFKLFCWFGK